jgi:hypothetical protein
MTYWQLPPLQAPLRHWLGDAQLEPACPLATHVPLLQYPYAVHSESTAQDEQPVPVMHVSDPLHVAEMLAQFPAPSQALPVTVAGPMHPIPLPHAVSAAG